MSPALLAVGVAVAGSLGAIARYALDTGLSAWLADRARARSGGRGRTSALPWATLLVNVSGSLLLGAVAGLSARHGLPHDALAIVGVGFCGGYTTFSAASVGAAEDFILFANEDGADGAGFLRLRQLANLFDVVVRDDEAVVKG